LQVLAFNEARSFNRHMPTKAVAATKTADLTERQVTALALRNIREQMRKTQGDIAAPLGMSTQAWQKYEAGERDFNHERMTRILAALGATQEAVDFEIARLRGVPGRQVATALRDHGRSEFVFDVYTRPQARAGGLGLVDAGEVIRRVELTQLLGPHVDALEQVGDELSPWAESGETLLYDRDRYPKPGKGCVIETAKGDYHVMIYDRSDGSTIFARTLNPARTHPFKLADLAGVYSVRLRGD